MYCIIYLFNNGLTNGIIIKYLSIRTIPLCHYQIQSSWLFEATSFQSLLNNPRSNHYLVMIGRLLSSSFVNVQYMIVGSLVIKSIVIFEVNGWLIETTILIQYHCKNKSEKQHNQTDRIDILIIIESWIRIKNRFETNKQSFHRNVPNQWLITEQFSIRITTDSNKISENGRNIYEWNQINQTLLEIDFDRTFWNEWGSLTFRRFGISK